MMWTKDSEPSAFEATATARAETMLALAPHVGMNLDLLELLRRRFDVHLSMLDAAEPARRAELEKLMVADFDELATAYKKLARTLDRRGSA